MEAKTDVSTQVWWFEVKKQTEVTITESSRDEAFGLLPSCCIDFSHLCFSWDFLEGYFGTLRVGSVFSTQQWDRKFMVDFFFRRLFLHIFTLLQGA